MDLQSMNVAALREECKARGITGYSKLKKDELIGVLSKAKGPAKRYSFKGRDRKRAKGKHNRNQARKKLKRQKRLSRRKGSV